MTDPVQMPATPAERIALMAELGGGVLPLAVSEVNRLGLDLWNTAAGDFHDVGLNRVDACVQPITHTGVLRILGNRLATSYWRCGYRLGNLGRIAPMWALATAEPRVVTRLRWALGEGIEIVELTQRNAPEKLAERAIAPHHSSPYQAGRLVLH